MTEPRFLEQLQELDAKAAAVREQEARGTAACADVRGVLDRLRVKVGSGLLRVSFPRASHGFPLCSASLALQIPGKSKEAGDVIQLVERLLRMHEAPGSVPSAVYVGMMAQVCCPSTQEVEEETEFGPRYMRPCLKNKQCSLWYPRY